MVKGISKSTARSPLGPHTFLHKINASAVKIRPTFRKIHNIDFKK